MERRLLKFAKPVFHDFPIDHESHASDLLFLVPLLRNFLDIRPFILDIAVVYAVLILVQRLYDQCFFFLGYTW